MMIFLILQFIVANAHASYQNQYKNQVINSIYYQVETKLVDNKLASLAIDGYQVKITNQVIKISDNKKTYQFDRFINDNDEDSSKKDED